MLVLLDVVAATLIVAAILGLFTYDRNVPGEPNDVSSKRKETRNDVGPLRDCTKARVQSTWSKTAIWSNLRTGETLPATLTMVLSTQSDHRTEKECSDSQRRERLPSLDDHLDATVIFSNQNGEVTRVSSHKGAPEVTTSLLNSSFSSKEFPTSHCIFSLMLKDLCHLRETLWQFSRPYLDQTLAFVTQGMARLNRWSGFRCVECLSGLGQMRADDYSVLLDVMTNMSEILDINSKIHRGEKRIIDNKIRALQGHLKDVEEKIKQQEGSGEDKKLPKDVEEEKAKVERESFRDDILENFANSKKYMKNVQESELLTETRVEAMSDKEQVHDDADLESFDVPDDFLSHGWTEAIGGKKVPICIPTIVVHPPGDDVDEDGFVILADDSN